MSINYPRLAVKNVRASIVHAFNNREYYDFGFMHERYDEFVKCVMVDDYGFSAPNGCENAKLYVVGHEYGYTHIVHSQNESDAHSAWVDTCHTIEASEVPEAYNAYDKLLERMVAKGHAHDGKLISFCNRWAAFYFYADTKAANYTGAWDRWELDEAYQMQSSSTGTGIVNMGHNSHMTKLKWSQLKAVRKAITS